MDTPSAAAVILAVREDQLHTYDGYRLLNRRYIPAACIALPISSIRKDRDSSGHDRFLCDPQGFAAHIHSLSSFLISGNCSFQRDKIQASVGSEPADAFYQCTGADRAAFAAAGTGAGVHNGTDNVIFAGSRNLRSPGFFAFRRSAWYKNRENAEIISTRSVRLPSLRSISL